MTIDEEMELWEKRSNDEFGTILKAICTEASEIVLDIKEPLSTCLALYALDGNRKSIANRVCNLLEAYDIIGDNEYIGIETALIELKTLIL